MGEPAQKSNVIPITRARSRGGNRGDGGNSRIGIMVGKGLSDLAMSLLEARFANPACEADYRNRALLFVMRETALRAAELLQLDRADSFEEVVDGEPGRVFRVRLKGGDTDGVFVSDATLAVVQEYHAFAGINSGHLFHSLSLRNLRGARSLLTTRGLQKIIRSWSVETLAGRLVHPHALRHTAIQKANDREGSLYAQKIARHRSAETTGRHYLKPYVNGRRLWGESARTGVPMEIPVVPSKELVQGDTQENRDKNWISPGL